MKTRILQTIVICMSLIAASCNSKPEETTEPTETRDMTNPFFSPYETPFGVPAFDKIKLEHYLPAFEEGMKEQIAETQAIINNPEAPSFENTIEALENSGSLLNKVSAVFFNLNSANTNDEMQEIAQELAPKMSEHSDNIYLNSDLFAKVKTIWEAKESLNLGGEQNMLLENTYKSFVRGGANLSEEQQKKLRSLNKEISSLTVSFGQNMLAETNSFKLVIDNKDDLAGLTEAQIASAASEAESAGMSGKWVFGLQNPSVMPFLQYAAKRELRQKIWEAYSKRCNNGNEFDNKEILVKTANLRNEKARLLGYTSHAHYVLEESMAKNPDKVYELLNKLWTPALNMAKNEAKELLKLLEKDHKGATLEPWDWRYYEEKLRTAKYNFDANELSPYFELNNVREGIFYTVNKLYGLTFKKLDNVPVYHEEVTAYEVLREDKHVGVLYLDFHPRESKSGGAWMTSFRDQERKNGEFITPVISIVCNFTKPSSNTPALLTFDEVTTYFHEFGHAIHGLLSNVIYRSLSGTSVPRDFVELPSQILECWAEEPEVLAVYAKHYQTGEIIPQALLDKMNKSSKYGQGFASTEYLAASLLDMKYHTQTQDISVDANTFEAQTLSDIGLISSIISRYRSTYFSHIFAGGYSAGYYSYIWSELLDADAFAYFKTKGVFDPATAKSFHDNILARGGTVDPAELYRNFRGQDPSVDALLDRRGLK